MTWTLRFCACSINAPQVHLFLKVKFCAFFCVENVVLDFLAPFSWQKISHPMLRNCCPHSHRTNSWFWPRLYECTIKPI